MSALDNPNKGEHTVALCAGAFGGLLLGVTDLGAAWASGTAESVAASAQSAYVIATVAIAIILLGGHGVLLGLGSRLAQRAGERGEQLFWIIAAAVFGGLWQDTLMHGDGIRAFAFYEVIRVVAAVVGTVGLGTYVWLLSYWDRVPSKVSKIVAALVGLIGLIANHTVIPDYTEFHGFLACFAAANLLFGASTLLRRKSASYAGWFLILASICAALLTPSWMPGQRYAQRYSQSTSALLKLPTTTPFRLSPESIVNRNSTFTAQQLTKIREGLAEFAGEPSLKRRGTNTLFIVLESTRADAWADPKIAPRFAKWRSHGTYFPNAIAQYPATPLAYGAMFTSQPPSVLTQTPAWARTRLFDLLSGQFDHIILTQPAVEWFDHSAIADFFVPQGAEVKRHKHVSVALDNLETGIRAVQPGESFFGWAHIYEPHQPWVARKEHLAGKGKGKRAAYLSEVSLVDDELGQFMEWFFAQPVAKDTLVVVFSDHGEGLGERVRGRRFFGHHVHVRNVVSHVPAFFAGPGVPKGQIAKDFTVQQLDVMPTMFDFLGTELPPDALPQGQSLFTLLETPQERPLVTEAFSIRGKEFFEFVAAVRRSDTKKARKRFQDVSTDGKYAPKIALQKGRYKIIRDMLLQRTFVYDIKADPDEKHDLSKSEPELLKRLTAELDDWRSRQSWVVSELESL